MLFIRILGKNGMLFIEYYCHLFQRMSSRFWIRKPHGDTHNNENANVYKIVLPGDCFQRDRVDEDVEEEGDVTRDLRKREAASAELIRPDFRRVRKVQSRTRYDQLAFLYFHVAKGDPYKAMS